MIPVTHVVDTETGVALEVASFKTWARPNDDYQAIVQLVDRDSGYFGVHPVRIEASWDGTTYTLFDGDALVE